MRHSYYDANSSVLTSGVYELPDVHACGCLCACVCQCVCVSVCMCVCVCVYA